MSRSPEAMREKLCLLYGAERGQACHARLMAMLEAFKARHPELSNTPIDPAERVTERDIMLITYGDSLQEPGTPPLQVLHRFLKAHLAGAISAVHILPFFPYSSDDGFSVIDYKAVNPDLGDWDDVSRLGADFKLMFDAVINHVSAQSEWFHGFKEGRPPFQNFFIAVDPVTDLSSVVRPRSLPLLTPVETDRGEVHVWTTFSADQIDLNYAHEDVLLHVIDVLLYYVSRGMSFVRLDAIAYLWKKIGTSSIHLQETHTVVRLLRDVLDVVAPHVAIITETNVPHAENVSYFGDGTNEAQLVYQFSLPPLTLHAFAEGDATTLSDWAAGLEKVSDQTTFFNFTASHDGIGVRPAEGILSAAEIEALVRRTKAHGGQVSYKINGDGSQSPYELNINYFDALSNPRGDDPLDVQVARFIASQAILLAFVGMPGIYIHSLLGSRSWLEGPAMTGRARTINRQKLMAQEVEAELADPGSLRHLVFTRYMHLITRRIREKAFHPNARQQVLDLSPSLFSLLRTSTDGCEHVVAIHNVAHRDVRLDLSRIPLGRVAQFYDLVSESRLLPTSTITIRPYQVLWLKAVYS